jgi:hypothetical protein
MTTTIAKIAATTEIQALLGNISRLPEEAIRQLADYAENLVRKQEIAALEAKYGTTPNAETIAAMREAEAGIGELVTLEQIQAECNALR